MAVLGLDRLGVKLHALDGHDLVAHTHDFAIIGPGRDFQALRQRFALYDQ